MFLLQLKIISWLLKCHKILVDVSPLTAPPKNRNHRINPSSGLTTVCLFEGHPVHWFSFVLHNQAVALENQKNKLETAALEDQN